LITFPVWYVEPAVNTRALSSVIEVVDVKALIVAHTPPAINIVPTIPLVKLVPVQVTIFPETDTVPACVVFVSAKAIFL
jgi:hypothetical protein